MKSAIMRSGAKSPLGLFPRLCSFAAASAFIGTFAVTQALAQTPAADDRHQLADVVVTAAGFEQALVDAPASITVITREELERKEITNIADALRGIEGVNVNFLDARDGKTGNRSISLRGMPREHTLILIDGVRQNTPGTVAPNSFVDSATVFFPPVAAIERIEVVRGPMSTLYGSDAIGGVVNIITRRPGTDWSGAVGVSNVFQSDSRFGGQSTTEAYVAGPLVKDLLSISLYGRLYERAESRIEIPGRPTDEPSLLDTRTMGQNPVGANVETVGAKLLFTPHPDHDITLGIDVTEQTYNNNRGQLGQLGGTDPANPTFFNGYSRELGFDRRQISAGYVGRFDLGTFDTAVTNNFVETTGRTINSGSVPEAERFGTPRKLESETWVVDSKFVMPLGNHTISIGGQYLDAELFDGIPNRTMSNYQYGLFIEDEWRMLPDLALTAGVRYEDHSVAGSEIAPRAYLVWRATDAWTFKGGAARGFRAPFLEQLEPGIIGFGSGGTVPLTGNPDLKPETSNNYEISALYNRGAIFSAQATAFYTELNNYIQRPSGAGNTLWLNIGEARVQGIELAARYDFARNWALAANYTYTDSEIKALDLPEGTNLGNPPAFVVGDPLVSVPDHMLNATLSWQATQNLNTFLNAEYRSSAFRPRNFHEPQDGGSAQGAFDALGRFKGYTLLNLGGSYHFTPNVALNATIFNLLDKNFIKYREYPQFNNPDIIRTSNVYNTIQEPRRLYVALNVAF